MKKKVLAAFLCAAMATTMLAGCGNSSDADDAAGTENADAEVTVESEELPEAFAHINFDGDDEGYTALVQTDNVVLDGANKGIEAAEDVTFSYADGPVGQALYLDGSYGLDLGLEATNTDTYTISYWVNADRLATFGPTLQIGYNIGRLADSGNDVTWLNVTQSEWGDSSSETSGKIFPVVWSRNEASNADDGTACFPWMYAFDDQIHGKKEWVMVTIVCTGETLDGMDGEGETTVGAQYYINGTLVYDSADNYNNGTYFDYTWNASLAPNIMQPGDYDFESYFGINYWDTVFKGFVDDLYVFDQALTAGQVKTLYELGDASVESVAPETDAAAEEEEEAAIAIEAVGTTVGSNACDTGWWSAFSDVWAVAEGESVTKTFTNYTDGVNNWDNFLVVLQNVAAGHSADDDAAYAEYAVCRADNYGWCGGDALADIGVTLESDWNWDTFTSDMNGAQIELTVTNNGGTTDVAFTATTVDGTVYNQSYTGIATDGDVYFCLTVEAGFLNDIQ